MKIINALLLIFIFALYACTENNLSDDGFVINGQVKGIPDSSWVFLQNDDTINDSAIVINNKFILSGQVDKPTICYLLISSTRDYKPLWIENSVMSFSAESGYFLDAKITGSETQREADKVWEKISPIRKMIDSLRVVLNENNWSDERVVADFKILQQRMRETEINCVRENPNSLPSVHTLDIYKTTWGKELTASLFSNFTNKLKMTKKGKSIERYIQLNKNPQIGEHYIDFELPNVDGKYRKLSDINAKVILLDFWASWCGPCRMENKNLVNIYNEFNSMGFEVLGISGDVDESSWLQAIKDDELLWENLRDEKADNSDPFLIYGINGIPDNFLINSEGVIIARNLRGDDLHNKLQNILTN